MKFITEEDVKRGLYNCGPAGFSQLRQELIRLFGAHDTDSTMRAVARLAEKQEISVVVVDGIQLWALPGQRLG